MKISIDGTLFAECSHSLGTWNGFLEPVFSREEMLRVQAECVRLGWDGENEDGVAGHLAGWHDLGNDEWVVYGWIWQEVKG